MKNIYATLRVMLIVLLTCSLAYAQDKVVSGKVISTENNEPLPGVNVVIKGTATGTITNLDGEFQLSVGNDATLIFSFLGFVTQEIAVGDQTSFDIKLDEDIAKLDEVVVTGLASSIKRSNLANAVSTVSAKELTGTTKAQTVDGALFGKLTGVNIKSQGGAPGGGVSVQLRGLSTISNGNSQPLYIIDGVYINNSAIQSGISAANGAGAGTGRGLQDDVSNRLADINPEDIESMEVLKGPSAAAIYGTRANAGVIIISTKKGTAGKTKIRLNQEVGYSEAVNLLGFASWDLDKINNQFGGSQQRLDDFNTGRNVNWEKEIYGEKGFINSTSLTITGGTNKTSFYVNGSLRDEDGIIKGSGFSRRSIRANIDHKISDRIKISSKSNYLNTITDRSWNGNQNGTGASFGYALSFTPPYADLFPDADGNYPDNGYFSENPLALRDKAKNESKVNRFIQSFDLGVDLYKSNSSLLKFTIQGGLDFLNSNTFAYLPEDLQHQRNSANPGDVFQGNSEQLNTNVQAFLTFNTTVNSLNLNTQIGTVKLTEDRSSIINRGQGLRNGQTNITTADIQTIFLQNNLKVRDLGLIAQQELNWDDKIVGTLGVRFDKSTLNLDQTKFYAFPKASVAVNVANFDFWSVEPINQLKLRAAYGETGGLPTFGTTFTQLNSVFLGTNGGNTLSTTTVDSNLKPETATELELGLDLGFLDSRGILEFTWYKKSVNDLIERLVPASSTGLTSITSNVGDLENTGIEIALSGSPIRTENFEWFGRVNWWTNNTEITRFDIPNFTRGGFGPSLGTNQFALGLSPTTIVGNPALPDGTFTIYGNGQPDWQMSLYNTLKYKGLEFSFMLHRSKGNDNINLSEFLWDLGGTSPDWNETGTYTRASDGQALTNGQGRPNDRAENGGSPNVYVQDASFWKLREVGLYYTLPSSIVESAFKGYVERVKFGVSGNHLFIWSNYRSYDPEVSQFSQDAVSNSVEVTPFPSARRIMFHLSLDF